MRKDSYFLLNCKQFVDIFFVLWTFADFFSGYASVWGPWYSQKQSMAEFILRMKSAIVREALLLLWRAVMVEVTGLEPATAWSQTRNATNCATPRMVLLSLLSQPFPFSAAKVMLLFESAKSFSIYFLLTRNVNCLLLTVAAYTLFIISVSSVNHNLSGRAHSSMADAIYLHRRWD